MRAKLKTAVLRATAGRGRGTARRGTGGRGVGVTALLGTLVLIPLSGMTALGVSAISTRRATVRHATHTKESLGRIDALIALREALRDEQAATDARLRAGALGLTTGQAGALFGLDRPGRLSRARAATDQALAETSSAAPQRGPRRRRWSRARSTS